MSQRVVIIGAGVIGLSTAYYCARRGFSVTVVDRKPAQRDGCSFGNAGMIVPSHFIPLAAPGMVALGLKWMWNPASPFYIKPRLDPALFDWGHKFWRAANETHVRRSGPLLRDLSLASRKCFEELAGASDTAPGRSETGSATSRDGVRRSGVGDFGLVQKGLLMLCQSEHALHEEAKMAEQARALGVPAEVLDAKQTAALDPGARLNIAGSIHFPLDCHLTTDRFMAALEAECVQLGVRFVWNTDATAWRVRSRGGVSTQRHSNTDESAALCRDAATPFVRAIVTGAAKKLRPTNSSFAVALVSGTRPLARTAHSPAGRQGLQPHAAQAAPVAPNLFHLHRGARGGDADGRKAPGRRHDGNRRLERGHQSRARARHH